MSNVIDVDLCNIVMLLVTTLARRRKVPGEARRGSQRVPCRIGATNPINPPSIGKLPSCKGKLTSLTKADLSAMAGGLNYYLKHEISEVEAVKKFIKKYPAISELSAKHPYTREITREMLESICVTALADKQQLAKVKLFIAAAMSIADMLTDLIVLVEFYRGGKLEIFYWTLGSILLNLVFQSIMCIVNTMSQINSSKMQIARELGSTWLLFKPGIDAWKGEAELGAKDGWSSN